MCQKLPYQDVKLAEGNFTEEHIDTRSNLGFGFILDVDEEPQAPLSPINPPKNHKKPAFASVLCPSLAT